MPHFSILRSSAFLLLCFFIVSKSTAQQARSLVFGGGQLTTAKYSVDGTKQSTDSKAGFQLGYGIKIPFETRLFFSPAAFYSLKGYKVSFNKPSDPPDLLARDNNTSIHSFELAFLLQYDFSSKPTHLFLKGGPTLDFQLSGKESYNMNGNGSSSRSMKYSFGDYGRYSGNIIAQLGVETRGGVVIYGQYSHGFVNLSNRDGGPVIFHRVFGLGIGKYFGRKKSSQAL